MQNNFTDIGFLGLGQMGGSMAERLLGKPFRLHVCDPAPAALKRFADAGAVAHDSPKSVADAASIVFACLPNQKVSLAVAHEVSRGAALKTYVEMSTIGKETIEAIAKELAGHDIVTVDSPVTGGPPVARAGKLTLLVSGESATVESLQPLFEMIGKNICIMGDRPGMGQTMKIVNNLIMAANVIVAAEGLTFGQKAGLDAARMLEVLRKGTGQSFSGCEILQRAVAGTFDYGSALTILDKDMVLGLTEADALGLKKVPVLESARDVWHEAYEAGWGDRDFTAVLTYIEEANGARVRAA